jgi:predicted restriction endonuclease
LKGEEVSLVQGLRKFFSENLHIDLRETQARGLMHKSSSVFIDYVREISGEVFVPGIQYWESLGLVRFKDWKEEFYKKRDRIAIDIDSEEAEIDDFEERFHEKPEVAPGRKKVIVTRIVRDTSLSRFLKALYQQQCQICRMTFRLPSGGKYVESHHIKPLGKKHHGIDHQSNMLVLCPNHHAMFDYGVIAIQPKSYNLLTIDRKLLELGTHLSLLKHRIDDTFLEYHVDRIYNKVF